MRCRVQNKNRHAKRFLGACLVGGLCWMSVPVTVWGATKPIGTVTIKVDSRLEPGAGLPEIELGSAAASGGVSVSESNEKYEVTEATWTDQSGKELGIADEPQMRVTLAPTDVSEYYFPATYKSSSIKISGGSFVSARRDGDDLIVTLRVRGVKGAFAQPEEAYWNEKRLGEARWEKPVDASGYYEAVLYRNGKQVYKVDQISSLRYDFYPYMTEKGEYTFWVRSIPSTELQKKYGKKSEWTESGELSITDRYVSDGTGKEGLTSSSKPGSSQAGWFQEGNTWKLRLPDGRICCSEWYMLDGLWYHFDEAGVMQTGWLQDGGHWYYLWPSGQMAVGWSQIDGQWYYFRPLLEEEGPQGSMVSPGWNLIGSGYYYFNSNGSMYKGWLSENGRWYYLNTLTNSLEGMMFTGWLEREGKTYFLDSDGAMVEGWYQIGGEWHYFQPGSGEMARSTHIDGFYVDDDGIWR